MNKKPKPRTAKRRPASLSANATALTAATLLVTGCGGSGSSTGTGNLYAVSKLSVPLELVPSPDPLQDRPDGYLGVTTDGRAFGGDSFQAIFCTAPDYGTRTSERDSEIGLGQGVIFGENRSGNVVVDAQGFAYYAAAISSSPSSYRQLNPLAGEERYGETALGMNGRSQIVAWQYLVGGENFLYYSSPTAEPERIYTSDYGVDIQPPAGAIDDQGHIALWVGKALFFSSPTAPPTDLLDINGDELDLPVFLGPDGTMLVHVNGQKPSYILAANPTVTKLVNLGTGTDGYVNFVNSSGIACGYFADSGGNKHACIWKSLAQPPTDESYIAPGLRLVNVDFDFDSGVLIATDTAGVQYKLTPAH